MLNNKFDIQNVQYQFPYHYLATLNGNTPSIKKEINWGFEYLIYINFILKKLDTLQFNSILDIGCGDGYLLNHLSKECKKYGVDLSKEAIEFANAFSHSAVFELKDIFDIEQKYDVVSLIEVLEHIPDELVEKFVKKSLELVGHNGYFIICVPTTVVPLHTKHYRHYDETLLSRHINVDNTFELIDEYRVYKESLLLKIITKMINNKLFTINCKFILQLFWKWNISSNEIATTRNGKHLIRIYKKII